MVVIVEQAMKVGICPNEAQQELLAKAFGCKRCCWNHWLDERETFFNAHGNTMGFKYIRVKELKKTFSGF